MITCFWFVLLVFYLASTRTASSDDDSISHMLERYSITDIILFYMMEISAVSQANKRLIFVHWNTVLTY